MNVGEAQKQVRTTYMGGLVGQLVSASIWLMSAVAASTQSMRAGAITLVVGGFFIFPITQLALRLSGHRASLENDNPLRELAIEVAIVAPLMLPLVGAAALYRLEWFYPAMMIAVGAHYLPFAFLYGMRHFLMLGGAMFACGLFIGLYANGLAITGAWVTVVLLAVFALVGWYRVRDERGNGSDARIPDSTHRGNSE